MTPIHIRCDLICILLKIYKRRSQIVKPKDKKIDKDAEGFIRKGWNRLHGTRTEGSGFTSIKYFLDANYQGICKTE